MQAYHKPAQFSSIRVPVRWRSITHNATNGVCQNHALMGGVLSGRGSQWFAIPHTDFLSSWHWSEVQPESIVLSSLDHGAEHEREREIMQATATVTQKWQSLRGKPESWKGQRSIQPSSILTEASVGHASSPHPITSFGEPSVSAWSVVNIKGWKMSDDTLKGKRIVIILKHLGISNHWTHSSSLLHVQFMTR